MEYDTPRRIVWRLLCLLLGALLGLAAALVWPGLVRGADEPLTAAWDAEQTHLVVTWSAPGCVWLVGGPGADVVAEGGCGASGAVRLGGGGDDNYRPERHTAVEWRPWGDGAPVRVAVPARVYLTYMPGVAR